VPQDLKAVAEGLDVGEHTAPGRVMLFGIAVARRPTEGLLRRRNRASKEPAILVHYRTEFLLSKCVGTILGRAFKTPPRLIIFRACSGSSSSQETVFAGSERLGQPGRGESVSDSETAARL
jgi:hypothetical protein